MGPYILSLIYKHQVTDCNLIQKRDLQINFIKMKKRNNKFIKFWSKDLNQIYQTVFVLDTSLESLNIECFEDNRNVDMKQSIEITDKELNLK